MAKSICVLSPAEVEALSAHQVSPRCANHHHISKSEAQELVREQMADVLAPKMVRIKRTLALRGFSCRFGEYLARMRPDSFLRQVLLAEIRR